MLSVHLVFSSPPSDTQSSFIFPLLFVSLYQFPSFHPPPTSSATLTNFLCPNFLCPSNPSSQPMPKTSLPYLHSQPQTNVPNSPSPRSSHPSSQPTAPPPSTLIRGPSGVSRHNIVLCALSWKEITEARPKNVDCRGRPRGKKEIIWLVVSGNLFFIFLKFLFSLSSKAIICLNQSPLIIWNLDLSFKILSVFFNIVSFIQYHHTVALIRFGDDYTSVIF